MARMVNELTGNEAGIKFVERRDWDVKKRLLSSTEKASDPWIQATDDVRRRSQAHLRMVRGELGRHQDERGF